MQKELIENSIKIFGIGHPDTKTVFDLNTIPVLAEDATEEQKKDAASKEEENQRILKDMRLVSLVKISGRKLTVSFKYKEDEQEKSDKLPMSIVKSDDGNEIKDFILNSIASYLAN